MWIDKINLQSFRNYSNTEVSFTDGTNIFIGDNAQGCLLYTSDAADEA